MQASAVVSMGFVALQHVESSRTTVKPMFSALVGRFLTNGPSVKSPAPDKERTKSWKTGKLVSGTHDHHYLEIKAMFLHAVTFPSIFVVLYFYCSSVGSIPLAYIYLDLLFLAYFMPLVPKYT